ncbi:MAG: sialate O-acetylesterase [Planctomycetota bacterium]
MKRSMPVILIVACGCAGGVYSEGVDAGATSSAATTGAPPIKIFLLAGQSNMVGPGSGKYIREKHPTLVEPREDVRCAWKGMKTGPLTPCYGFRSEGYGPELLFGHVLGDALEEPVLLVKSGVGGTTLHKTWRPPSTVARAGGEVGPLYTKMMRFLYTVLDHLDDQCPDWSGRGFEIAGFVWFQGENDTCAKDDKTDPATGYWNFYEENLRDLIKDVRAGVGVPDLPVLIIQINDSGCWEAQGFQVDGKSVRVPSGPVVRAAQRKVAETTPGCAWIETLDLNEGYHYDSPSHVEIGLRAGKAMLPLTRYRRRDHGSDPGVLAARARERDARQAASALPAAKPDTSSLSRGLIAYFPFDEGEGAATTGLGPKRLRGVLKGGAGWQEGLLGRALRLEGDQSVEVPDFREPLGTSGRIEALSVSFWMQTPCRDPHQRVGKGLGRKYEKIDNKNWAISQRANVAGWDVTNHDIDGFFFFTATFRDGPREAHAGWRDPNSHTDGYAWRHVAAVYNGNTRRFELYVDGKRTEAVPKDLGASHIAPADVPLTIGGPMTASGHHAYDELAIWSRALTPEEITTLFNKGRGVRIP